MLNKLLIKHSCGNSPVNLDCRVTRAGASVLAEPRQGAREQLVKVGDELHALGEEGAILSNRCQKIQSAKIREREKALLNRRVLQP